MSGSVGDCDGSLPSVTSSFQNQFGDKNGSFQNQQRKRGIAALLDVSNQRFQGHRVALVDYNEKKAKRGDAQSVAKKQTVMLFARRSQGPR